MVKLLGIEHFLTKTVISGKVPHARNLNQHLASSSIKSNYQIYILFTFLKVKQRQIRKLKSHY